MAWWHEDPSVTLPRPEGVTEQRIAAAMEAVDVVGCVVSTQTGNPGAAGTAGGDHAEAPIEFLMRNGYLTARLRCSLPAAPLTALQVAVLEQKLTMTAEYLRCDIQPPGPDGRYRFWLVNTHIPIAEGLTNEQLTSFVFHSARALEHLRTVLTPYCRNIVEGFTADD